MTFVDALLVIGIFAGFGIMIYSRLNKRNSPVIIKAREYFRKKNIIKPDLSDSEKWKQPMIERKIM